MRFVCVFFVCVHGIIGALTALVAAFLFLYAYFGNLVMVVTRLCISLVYMSGLVRFDVFRCARVSCGPSFGSPCSR